MALPKPQGTHIELELGWRNRAISHDCQAVRTMISCCGSAGSSFYLDTSRRRDEFIKMQRLAAKNWSVAKHEEAFAFFGSFSGHRERANDCVSSSACKVKSQSVFCIKN